MPEHPGIRTLVLDADALNIISEHPEMIAAIPEGSVLTPHVGELKRLVRAAAGCGLLEDAGTAAAETEGIALATAPVNAVKGFFGKKSQSKGVKVTVEESNALIEVEISVKFGINIKKVCEEVQAKVKNAVETMTGLTVSGVNVIVSDVWAEKEKQVPAAEEMDEETKAE